jgi:homoaconitase/3-isopropylmalate dehydratase large subunit
MLFFCQVFDDHKVADMGGGDGKTALMYIDRHLIHEVGAGHARRFLSNYAPAQLA